MKYSHLEIVCVLRDDAQECRHCDLMMDLLL